MEKQGGMCSNPFGGHIRLDRLDFTGLAHGSEQKLVYLQTITDAVHNYLFFGLGRNGTTAEEFAYAYEYIFKIRADDASTWPPDANSMEENIAGKPKTIIDLSDDQVRHMCFDTHYNYAGLNDYLAIDKFIKWLLNIRKNIIQDNIGQINVYLDSIYLKACKTAKIGMQLPLSLIDRESVLLNPSPIDVAHLIYLPKKYRATRTKKPNGA